MIIILRDSLFSICSNISLNGYSTAPGFASKAFEKKYTNNIVKLYSMKRKYECHKNFTTMSKKIFNTRYGQITVTVVHNQLEFQIPNTMSSDALLKWKVINRQLLEQLRKDERIN